MLSAGKNVERGGRGIMGHNVEALGVPGVRREIEIKREDLAINREMKRANAGNGSAAAN